MKRLKWYVVLLALAFVSVISCTDQELQGDDSITDLNSIDLAQTSGQLASGMSFSISGSSTDVTSENKGGFNSRKRKGRRGGVLDGLYLLAPNDELLAIIDAESASDLRGLRISKNGGATILHFDANGDTVTLSLNGGPHGCSFSGKQFPEYDSLLGTIVRTEINFGDGVTVKKDTIEITRSGKITIQRTVSGSTYTEVTTFENYVVNGIAINGVKTRVSTYDEATGDGSSATSVANGTITLADGTVATWLSEKSRVTDITLNADGGLESGTITITADTSIEAGEVIYSHKTTTPLVENLSCEGKRKGPVSGFLETIYRDNVVTIDFGAGSCTDRTITITINGETTTKTIGGSN